MRKSAEFNKGVQARARVNRAVSTNVRKVSSRLGKFGKFVSGFIAGEAKTAPKKPVAKKPAKRTAKRK